VRQSGDEIEQLSVTLNEMLARIQHAFERTKQFTADASHELRTPVSLIRTEAEICLRRTRSAEEYRAALTHILNEAVRTSDLIETLLQLARADAGKAALEFQVIDARPLVEDVVEGWRSILEQSSLGISLAMPQEPVFVLAEAMALRRLLAILLDNARKYTPAGGNIAIEVAGETDSVNIRVRDTGIGISPENIEHIFDRFFRADTVRVRTGGAGLGLSLAKWIVEQHSGRLMVESPAGQGSTFTVSLPRSAAATVPAENSPTKLNERSIS
jgi:signal transduction histidine kinase